MVELLLKASFALAVGLLFYKLLLQQESFFAANRFYLIGCIALAFALPFVSLPQMVNQQGYLATSLKQTAWPKSLSETENTAVPAKNIPQVSAAVDQKMGTIRPSPPQLQAERVTEPASIAKNQLEKEKPQDWLFWLSVLYLFGVVVFALSLLFQLGIILYKIGTATDKIRDGAYIIVCTQSRQAPCSFFRYIFIYPDDYDFETYGQIIAHEKIHARLGHSLDLIIAEITVIALWFNPVTWLFKQEIEKNNEYQTDALLLEKEQVRRDQYQLNLLQIAVPNKPLRITTNYNQSLLKQRIMMMNAKKSTPIAYWKYTFLGPLFFGTLLLMNEPAISQHTKKNTFLSAPDSGMPPLILNPSERIVSNIKETISQSVSTLTSGNIPVEPKKPVAERAPLPLLPEPTPDNRETLPPAREPLLSINQRPEQPGNPVLLSKGLTVNMQKARTDMTTGYWYSSQEGTNYCIQFKGSAGSSNWNMSECFNRGLFQKQGPEIFTLTKETGTLRFTGNLDAEVGQGKYTFTEDASFRKFLTENNITSTDQNLMFHLFLGDITKAYVSFLKKEYNEVSGNRLLELAIHGIPQEAFQNYIALFQKYNNKKPSIQEVVEARIHGIDEAYVQELQRLGYTNLSLKKMMEAKIHGVSTAYVQSLKNAGFDNLPLEKIISAKIHDVQPAAIKEMQALGFGDLTLDKIIELKTHGISATYISDLKSIGFNNLTLNQVIEAKIHGLNPTSVKEFRALGYTDLGFQEVISAKIHGVSTAYVEELKKAGFQNITLNKVIEAKIHGIDSNFIKQSREKGYNLSSIDKYITLKIHGSAMESLKN